MSDADDYLRAKTAKLGIGQYRRHVLLCAGPRCCSAEDGDAAYEALKDEIKNRGLMDGPDACYRTRVNCLRVCGQGPVGVVYPEGTWYHGLSAERMGQLVERHLQHGKPIAEWTFAQNPLPRPEE